MTSAAPSSPEELLAGLDDGQREAASSLLGPVCILAGAGTGKTRAVTHRIAYGVATGAYPPERVMALTFTARAAAELRSRLRGLGADRVRARTFHAAALSQLDFFWPQVVGGRLPSVLDGKARVLGQAAESLRLKVDTATLRDVASEIEWRKVSSLSVDDYAALLADGPGSPGRPAPGMLDAGETVALQRAYERIKDERHQLDFEDVLLACAGMIEAEPRVALHVREQYRFFVVDEYQDVSPLQQQLLELWLGTRDDVCVVGDASQTIYSFAGADSRYLLDFDRRHPGARVVTLDENFRSAPSVLDTANRLMRGRAGAVTLRTSRDAARDERAEVPVVRHRSDTAEARAVAESVARDVAAGIRPSRIAVLYRVNAQSAPLERALGDAGLGVQVRGGARYFDRPEVRQALLALRGASIAAHADTEPLFKSVSDVLRGLGWTNAPPEERGAVRERWDALDALMRLADAAPPGARLRSFTDELLERQAAQHAPDVEAVTLSTLHASKGLEWDSVHLVGLSEGLVPITYARSPELVDEERRLLYVGVTRARRRLSLTWAEHPDGRSATRQPSRFLAELDSRTPAPPAR